MTFSHIEEAFRLMQTGKHVGKIVLGANENDLVPVRLLPQWPETQLTCY